MLECVHKIYMVYLFVGRLSGNSQHYVSGNTGSFWKPALLEWKVGNWDPYYSKNCYVPQTELSLLNYRPVCCPLYYKNKPHWMKNSDIIDALEVKISNFDVWLMSLNCGCQFWQGVWLETWDDLQKYLQSLLLLVVALKGQDGACRKSAPLTYTPALPGT